MTTYYALVSLLQDLEQYNRIFGSWDALKKEEIANLYNAVSLMDQFLRDSSELSYNHEFVNQVDENRITSLLYEARLHVDFWVVQHLNGRWSFLQRKSESPSIAQITQDMVSINQELKRIRDSSSAADESSTWLTPSTTTPTPNTEAKLIGHENDFVIMLDWLTGQQSQLKVFPIIGMAGIGKTTFSKKLYDNPLVLHHFYVRVWVTVSQQYQVSKILMGVLRCVANDDLDDIHGRSTQELREKVYRILKCKRYLLVLDDMWDTKAWDDLKRAFPDDKNGSRIILTSRLRDVAIHASQDTPPYSLRCLSILESWELLSSKIFVDESCPEELVDIGKEIAYKCHGLPLSIVVVGGLLSKMNRKLGVWEEVARSVGSLVMEESEHCQYVLALSYHHLPDYLKPCFLYMGMFPEDYEITVKQLIWLWVAEGFIRTTTRKSLEDVAEDYLADLTARSLILVKSRKSGGRSKFKTCYVHDLMRELCVRESHKHNFLHVVNNSGRLHTTRNSHDLPRLSFHSSLHEYSHKASFPYTRSLMSFEKLSVSDSQDYFNMFLKLLKVVNIINISLLEIPTEILSLTELKFLALTIQTPLNIEYFSKFSLLETLIIDCEWDGYLSSKFWDMVDLRHFHLKRSCQSYSSQHYGLFQSSKRYGSFQTFPQVTLPLMVLKNLTSVSTIRPISCTERIFLSLPHLKSLGVFESEEDYQFRGWFKRLVHLPELEKLKYVFSNPFVSQALKPDRLPPWQSFPPKLRKLTLSGTSLPWDDMSMLSLLPNLEVLKLRNYAFSGAVWKSMTDGFRCLKFLLIGSTNLETWETDGTHFPNLQHLVLRHCRFLKEIPYSIGEAPLLETIDLHGCKNSAVISARNLQEEQQNIGNDGLTIYITES